MRNICSVSFQSETKAIVFPSGDQTGERPECFLFMRRVSPEPSAFAMKMEEAGGSFLRGAEYTSLPPSGDQEGSAPPWMSNLRAPSPVLGNRKMPLPPWSSPFTGTVTATSIKALFLLSINVFPLGDHAMFETGQFSE